MLVLTRHPGQRVFCGYDINWDDPENSSEIIMKLEGVQSDGTCDVSFTHEPEPEAGMVDFHFQFNDRFNEVKVGPLFVACLSVVIVPGQNRTFVRFGFAAPDDMDIVREELIRGELMREKSHG